MSKNYKGAVPALLLASACLSISVHALAADLLAAPIAGGWSGAPLQDENVKKAAQFAIATQERQTRTPCKLLAIKHARQQVVAGTNFSMNLMVQAEGKRRLVIAEVWAKPDGSMQLTRWHWV